jgi:hypothetical protein
MARTLDDVLARRTRALSLDARAALRMAPAVARLMAAELGRDEAWQRQQLAEFAAIAKRLAPLVELPDLDVVRGRAHHHLRPVQISGQGDRPDADDTRDRCARHRGRRRRDHGGEHVVLRGAGPAA